MAFYEGEYVSALIKSNYRLIRDRLGEIRTYEALRDEVVSLLEDPRLEVLDRCDEALGEVLLGNGYIDDISGFTEYFDGIRSKKVNSFIGSAGSRLGDHHAYPGGLVNHTAANIELALSVAGVYQQVYRLQSDGELLILAMALHDLAKATVLAWDDHGMYPEEFRIAGTEAHHILSLSEAVYRGFPFSLVKAMCFCHVRLESIAEDLRNYLQAAFLIAGRGLSVDEVTIDLEDVICFLADSDVSIGKLAMEAVTSTAKSDGLSRDDLFKLLSSQSEFAVFKGFIQPQNTIIV